MLQVLIIQTSPNDAWDVLLVQNCRAQALNITLVEFLPCSSFPSRLGSGHTF